MSPKSSLWRLYHHRGHGQILGPLPKGDLVAYGANRYRDREVFFSDVEVAHAESGRTIARGTVLYRIVTD